MLTRGRVSKISHLPEHRPQQHLANTFWQLRSIHGLEDALCIFVIVRCGLASCIRNSERKVARSRNISQRRAREERTRPEHVQEHSSRSVELQYPELTFDMKLMEAKNEIVVRSGSLQSDEQGFHGLLGGVLEDCEALRTRFELEYKSHLENA